MKILSTTEYNILKRYEKIIQRMNLNHTSKDKEIYELKNSTILAKTVELIESNSLFDEFEDFDSWKSNLNNFAKDFQVIINYDFIVLGVKKDKKLIDLDTIYKGETISTLDLNNMKEVDVQESIVGKLINNNEVFYWNSEEYGSISIFQNFQRIFGSSKITEGEHTNISRYFSFLSKEIGQLAIVPISSSNKENPYVFGYLILVDKNTDYIKAEEIGLLNKIKNQLFNVYKNHFKHIQADRDSQFISEIFQSYFDSGIDKILSYLNNEFGFIYSSFWVPTLVDTKNGFGLKAYQSSTLSAIEIDYCKQFDFYYSNQVVLGKIKPEKTHKNEIYDGILLFDDYSTFNVGFNATDGCLSSTHLYVSPIVKYTHHKFEEKREFLGFFCMYLDNNQSLEDLQIERLSNFMNRIQFYIEHIVYDSTFHAIRTFSNKYLNITVNDIKLFYHEICILINQIMQAEHTSLFIANRDKNLFLKSSTSSNFINIDKKTKNIVKKLDKKDYENKENHVIYSSLNSLTFKSYITKEYIMVQDVFSDNIQSDLSFCEETIHYHKTIILAPIIIDNNCLGVIRCVNKDLSSQDSLLNFFSKQDLDILKFIIGVIGNQFLKAKTIESQQLFIEKLAHENKTPVQIIWSAIFNIEEKLSPEIFKPILSNFGNIKLATSVLNNNYSNLNTLLRSKEDKVHLFLEYIRLKDRIEEITILLKPLLQEEENKSILIKHNLHKMPRIKVDEAKFYQVIYNVLSNAVRYCDFNSTIQTFYKSHAEVRINKILVDCIEIKFENYGIGIPREDVDRIFDEFHRSPNAQKRVPNGTGIGLYVCKTIIEGHGGQIKVTNRKDPTVFSIYLPKKLVEQ